MSLLRMTSWSLVVLSFAASAHAGTVTGTVFVDLDRDGALGDGEDVVANAVVFFETTESTVTGADGTFSLVVGGPGLVWVSVPDGFQPGPVWQLEPTGADAVVDLGLTPVDGSAEARTFVVASDTHAGLESLSDADLGDSIRQLVDLEPRPAFFTITGDLTQSNRPEQFDRFNAARAGIDVPFVPVPGNHDWYDGGYEYRRRFGPPSYSFDSGGIHYIVLNDAGGIAARIAFVARDLAYSSGEGLVVAFTHAPPSDEVVGALERAGVDYLFTGHLHSNRVLMHDLLIEHNTAALAMGGADTTPAGFRVVAFDADDAPVITHRTTVRGPLVELVYPRDGAHLGRCRVPVIAAIEVGGGRPVVTARSGDEAVVLTPTGAGWTYTGQLERACQDGAREVVVSVELEGRESIERSARVCVEATNSNQLDVGEWPQLGGGAAHRGTSEAELAPPLHTLWAVAIDGHLHGGSPIVVAGTVIVPIADFGDGQRGGVVAVDARTGIESWRYRTGAGVRSAPAATADTVVIAGLDGMVHAVARESGALRWTYQVSAAAEPMSRSIYASPTISGDQVFVGNQREFVALDLETGSVEWSLAPGLQGFYGSYVSPAVADDLVIATFAQGGLGLHAWDAASGTRAWQTDRALTLGMHASPVVDETSVYVVDWQTAVTSIDRLTGEVRWSRRIDDAGFEWGYGVTATPALAGDLLLVPTHSVGLVAVDRLSGAEVWREAAGQGVIRASHYQGAQSAAFAASPVVAGSLVWLGGVDGILRGLDRSTGELAWSVDLGAPITMGAAAAGDLLIVGTYDGTLRALVPAARLGLSPFEAAGGCLPTALDPPPITRSDTHGGCGCGSSDPTGAGALILALALALRPRRRTASDTVPGTRTPGRRAAARCPRSPR